MSPRHYRPCAMGCWTLIVVIAASAAEAASPSAQQALNLVPVQKGVDFDRPTADEAAQCQITPKKEGGRVGWVVESPDGITLRNFVDTNGDNVVDQWSYYKDGLEVYRDIDANFNGKADQYRWFHTAGSRWGLDKDEDGRVDSWRSISAEEVTAEIVGALAERDLRRFERVALSRDELESLGLGAEKSKTLADRIAAAGKRFEEIASQQKAVTPDSKWLQFSGNQPGLVPAGTDGSTKDLNVYENVTSIVRTDGQYAQVQIGTLVQVGGGWRAIDAPQPLTDSDTDVAASGFFFRAAVAAPKTAASTGEPSDRLQEMLGELEKYDVALAQATSDAKRATLNAERADLLERIAEEAGNPQDRELWLHQLADTVSAAVQSGGYPEGGERLGKLVEKLEKSGKDKGLAGYVKFRQLTAGYGLALQTPDADIAKIQDDWFGKLEKYVADYPASPDAAEAMMQLAIAQEFAGKEEDAKKWYDRIATQFPNSVAGTKAGGAMTRLDSVGKEIALSGKSPTGSLVDLSTYRGKVVLIQYWATSCEPCKADMATLKELVAKYGRSGFNIIGVNLDRDPRQMSDYLTENRLPWVQIYEEGGMDSRPANELGILTLPTMILIGPDGKVVNRNIHVAEIDRELQRLIRR